jgi:DNA-binding FadR family transcriptional regulator
MRRLELVKMSSTQDIIAKPSLSGHERVTEFLRKQLMEGRLKVGDRLLPERELAVRLGVSRPVVREALRSLAAMGILEIRAGFGTVVRPIDRRVIGDFFGLAAAQQLDLLDDILEVRIALERQAVWLACERMRKSDIAVLEAAFQRLEDTFDDPVEGAKADFEFHLALIGAGDSSSLSEMYNIAATLMKTSHANIRAVMDRSEENRKAVLGAHRAILDALTAGDRAEADRALLKHYWRS